MVLSWIFREEYYNMKFTYTGKALETKLMIEEGRKVYTINKLYKHSRAFIESK